MAPHLDPLDPGTVAAVTGPLADLARKRGWSGQALQDLLFDCQDALDGVFLGRATDAGQSGEPGSGEPCPAPAPAPVADRCGDLALWPGDVLTFRGRKARITERRARIMRALLRAARNGDPLMDREVLTTIVACDQALRADLKVLRHCLPGMAEALPPGRRGSGVGLDLQALGDGSGHMDVADAVLCTDPVAAPARICAPEGVTLPVTSGWLRVDADEIRLDGVLVPSSAGQRAVIALLVDASPGSLPETELSRRAGLASARNALRDFWRKNPGWRGYIRADGAGGYRLTLSGPPPETAACDGVPLAPPRVTVRKAVAGSAAINQG